MEIIGPLLISTIAGLSTVIGSFVIFFKLKKQHINKFITFALSFSLSIMIGISITDLIPSSTYHIIMSYGFINGIGICIFTFILGVLLVHILNKKINRCESKDCSLYKVGILSMIALMAHNLPEGIATFMSAYQDMSLGLSLGLAIMMHNIPEGISIAVPIYYATKSKKKAISKTFISGLAEPLGAILAYIFLSKFITNTLISTVLMLVAGIMISLSINELFPQALEYKENKFLYWGLLIGTSLIILQGFLFA